MSTVAQVDDRVFASLKVCELWDGWESIQNYAIIRAAIPVGERVTRRLRHSSKARPTIAALITEAPSWPAFRLGKPVVAGGAGDIAEFVHPLDADYGFSTALVALVDDICGRGGWRVGSLPIALNAPVLAKLRGREPLALIAPAKRAGWLAL